MEIHLSQIIFQIINFGVVLGALTFLLYKPILKTLQNRSKKIEESQKAAEEILTEKEEIDRIKKDTLSKAKKEAAKLVEQASDLAEEKKGELMKKAKAEVKVYLEDEKKKWEAEKKTLLKNMEKDFSQAVMSVTDKILGKNIIDAKSHTKLIDQSIKEVIATL